MQAAAAGTGLLAAGAGTVAAQESAQGLLVNDYDGDPAWPEGNDIGNWADAGGFANGGGNGEVVDGALRLEYDNAGWFGSNVGRDVSDYERLEFVIRGDEGGEGSHFAIKLGGVVETFGDVADGSIGTSFSTVSVPLSAVDADWSSLPSVRFNFWEGANGSGAVEIDEMRFAAGSAGGGSGAPEPTPDPGEDTSGPSTPGNLAATGTTESSVTLSWSASTDEGTGVDHYIVEVGDTAMNVGGDTTEATVDGLSAGTTYDVAVTAVDGAGNQSAAATATATIAAGSDEGLSASFEVPADTVAPGEEVQARLVVPEVSGDMTGMDATVTVEDPSVATIADATPSELLKPSASSVSADGSSVSIRGGDVDNAVDAGATDVTVATVTLAGEGEGETAVSAAGDVDTADGARSSMSASATLAVATDDGGSGDDGSDDGEDGTASDGLVVDLPSSAEPGDEVEATVVLPSIAGNPTGFDVEVSIDDTSVATITGIETADWFRFAESSVADGGAFASFRGGDVNDDVPAGATDVTLATVTMTVEGEGEASVSAAGSMDLADGSQASASGSSTIVVGDGGAGDGEDGTASDGLAVGLPSGAEPGDEVEATITLPSIAGDPTGFDVEVSIDDTSVATITGIETADWFRFAESSVADNGGSASFRGGDVNDDVPAGATDVPLATVTLAVEGEGEASLTATGGMDLADGGRVSASGSSTIVVGDGGVDDGSGDDGSDDGEDGTASDGLVVDLPSGAEPGDEVEATVVLPSIAGNPTGFDVEVSIDDTSVATITGIETADWFRFAESSVADGGAFASFRGGDVNDDVPAGATDVTLATVTMTVEGEGEASVSAAGSMDLADGSQASASGSSTLVVGDGGAGDEGEDDAGGGDDGTGDGSGVSLDLASDTVAPGEEVAATITLPSMAGNMTGFYLDLTVSDTDVVTVDSATIPGSFQPTSATVSGDGATATLRGGDVNNAVQPDAVDVDLGTVTLVGEAAGEADVSVEANVDMGDGSRMSTSASAPLSVETEGGEGDAGDGTGDGSDDEDDAGDGDLSVDLEADDVPAGGTVDAELVLGAAPEGVAGFDLAFEVSDTSIATIADGGLLERFQGPAGGADVGEGSMTATGIDFGGAVQPGATDVTLATVTLAGESEGDVDLSLSVDRLTDDDGGLTSPGETTTTLVVGGDSGGDEDDADDGSDDGEPGDDDGTVGGGVDGEGVDLALSPAEAAPGGTVEATILLPSAPTGISGFNATLEVADPAVATITDAGVTSAFGSGGMIGGASVADDGGSVSMNGTDLGQEVQPGAADVTLATVTLDAESTGSTELVLSTGKFDDDDGNPMSVGDVTAVLSVTEETDTGGVSPINGITPQDIDDDGLYEDLNANGEVEFTDVIQYYYERDDEAITSHPEAYDFNGNGGLDLADVVSLFEEMSG